MAGNTILNHAKYSSGTDEWYTPYDIIEEELSHYTSLFENKIVLCNCDDPYGSNFTYYFLKHFNVLKIKKLICTSYTNSKINQISNNIPFSLNSDNHNSAHVLSVLNNDYNKNTILNDDEIKELIKNNTKPLDGDGDFRSDECLAYLKKCDICCTNPPFSLFSDLFSLLMKYQKQFLLIGNQNAITYKEIFPFIKENKVWVGYRFGDMHFRVPDDTPPRNTRFWVDETGQKWRSLGNAMWLTNLDIPKKHKKLKLTQTYEPSNYPKYDNFDAIHVKKVVDIPKDYYGIMGVPITFLKYYNDEQFEIVGEANHGSDNEFDLFKPKINGKEIFKRILIRKKEKYRILDLFCGAGGFSYGMDKNPSFKTVEAVDFDEKAADTFKKNMPYADVIVGDITQKEIKERVIETAREKKVNMIIGGPPCQGYSMKGKKLGLKDPRNFLFREYLNIVEELQPEIFVIENVKGILLSSNGWFKDEIINTINTLGYYVNYGILNAADFGVPQARERAIFICSKDKAIPLPKKTQENITTVKDAIFDLAYLNSGEGDFKQEYITEATSDYQVMMRTGSDYLYNHKASKHKEIAIKKLEMIPPECGKDYLPDELLGKQKFKTTWGRLKWNEVSPTIDTRFDASSNGTNNHPFLHRAITPREAARIQSFDDKFIFYGSKVYIRKQIGNAVPPLLAQAIANKIEKEMEK